MRAEVRMMASDLARMDKEYTWHPFTQMSDYLNREPLVIVGGEGAYLIDSEGNRYLDGVSSLWVNIHGHRRPEIDRAITEQLGKIAHTTMLGLANEPASLLAERLVKIAPGNLGKVFYSDNGSTAMEVAIKIAYQYWVNRGEGGRTRFLSLENAYHGDTLGAVSIGGIDLFHACYRPLLFPAYHAPSPYCYRCPLQKSHPSCGLECLNKAEEILSERSREIIAIVAESAVQGAAGMIVMPPGYLKGLEELARRYGVPLILDEVAMGFGRTGTMFACEHEGVKPDIMALAKGITGGYLPLAATLVTEEIFGAFVGGMDRTFYHGHSYTGNPLACAAALATLEIFEQEQTLRRIAPLIDLLTARLDECRSLAHVGDVRQKGLVAGIELVQDRESGEPYPSELTMGYQVIYRAREEGVIIRPLGNVIVVMPPLCVTEEELNRLMDVIILSIREVTEGPSQT